MINLIYKNIKTINRDLQVGSILTYKKVNVNRILSDFYLKHNDEGVFIDGVVYKWDDVFPFENTKNIRQFTFYRVKMLRIYVSNIDEGVYLNLEGNKNWMTRVFDEIKKYA